MVILQDLISPDALIITTIKIKIIYYEKNYRFGNCFNGNLCL